MNRWRKATGRLGLAVWFAFAAGVWPAVSSGGAITPFQNGEKVTALGDSITHGGFYEYYLQLFFALRSPDPPIVENAGVSGDRAAGALKRLKRDVLDRRPDRVLVMFGMNDVGRRLYAKDGDPDPEMAKRREAALSSYRKNLTELVRRLKAAGCRVVLLTPTPYDQYGELKIPNLKLCNSEGLSRCAEIVRNLAAAEGVGLVELHRPLTELLEQHPGAHLCGPDRVHPGRPGHLIVAALILQAAGASPMVGEVVIDAGKGRASFENVKLDNLKFNREGASFRYVPQRLPFPVTADYEAAERVFPLSAALNREVLKLTGLNPGQYLVTAGGRELGRFSAEQLAAGIDLTRLPTPSAEISARCLALLEQLAAVERRLRMLVLVEETMRNRQVDPRDAAAVREFIAAEQAAKKGMPTYLRRYRQYEADLPRRDELTATAEKLRAELLETSRPRPFDVEVTPVR